MEIKSVIAKICAGLLFAAAGIVYVTSAPQETVLTLPARQDSSSTGEENMPGYGMPGAADKAAAGEESAGEDGAAADSLIDQGQLIPFTVTY